VQKQKYGLLLSFRFAKNRKSRKKGNIQKPGAMPGAEMVGSAGSPGANERSDNEFNE
jgi:hypothetical protein